MISRYRVYRRLGIGRIGSFRCALLMAVARWLPR